MRLRKASLASVTCRVGNDACLGGSWPGKTLGIGQRRRYGRRGTRSAWRPDLGAIGLALLGVTASARADSSSDAERFQYEAPPDCPNKATFLARLRERVAPAAEPPRAIEARTVRLRVVADGRGFLGTAEFLDEAGTSRSVHGEQCDAVVTSLALIAALALDPTLAEEPGRASTPTPPTPPPPTPSTPTPPTPPPTSSTPPPPAAAAPSPNPTAMPSPGFHIGASFGYETAIGAWSYGLFGQHRWSNSFALRFTGHYASVDREIEAGRSANLQLLGLSPSACYGRLQTAGFSLTPCVAGDFGLLRGEGLRSSALPNGSSKTVGWASVGLELRLGWEPARSFWLEVHGGAQFPSSSYEFRFELPESSVYAVPRVTASVGLATGVRFW